MKPSQWVSHCPHFLNFPLLSSFMFLSYLVYHGFQHFYCTFFMKTYWQSVVWIPLLVDEWLVFFVSDSLKVFSSFVPPLIPQGTYSYIYKRYPDDQCFAGGSSSTSVLRFLFRPGVSVFVTALFPGPQFFGFSWYLTNLTVSRTPIVAGCRAKLASVLPSAELGNRYRKCIRWLLHMLFGEQATSRGSLRYIFQFYWVNFDPRSIYIMELWMRCICFQRSRTGMWTRYGMASIKKCRPDDSDQIGRFNVGAGTPLTQCHPMMEFRSGKS